MGWIKREAKAFGREFKHQGSILLFGKASKNKHQFPKRKLGAERQYIKAQRSVRQHGFK